MASQMWGVKLAVLVLGLLLLVPESTQLNLNHPLHNVVQRVNLEIGPFLGMVISSERDEHVLRNSTLYTPNRFIPSITIFGRRFNFGTFKDVQTIYVLAGEPLANVGAVVQLLVALFPMTGIISYGSAATITHRVRLGDVVVPSQVAYTGSWKWHKYNSVIIKPGMKFGDYNLPRAGENVLANIEYQAVPIYTPTNSNPEKSLFINVHPDWVKLASEINYGVNFTVHSGPNLRIGTSDVYMLNYGYGRVLSEELGISAVETHSAAVVSVAIANGIPHIVFRGISGVPGAHKTPTMSETAANNVLKTVATFVDAVYPAAASKNYAKAVY